MAVMRRGQVMCLGNKRHNENEPRPTAGYYCNGSTMTRH